MEPEFWHERWERGEIGFHQHDFNRHMRAFIGRLQIAAGSNVLVPLCGKSLDMLWLAREGFRVTGIEISERAVTGFFSENNLDFKRSAQHGSVVYRAGRICIHHGDFFEVRTSEFPAVDAVYDRASLVALPQHMRKAYVQQMNSLVPARGRCLLVTLDYPQREMAGPPFSVPGSEVKRLFGPEYHIERIHSEDCLALEPRFREKGLSRLAERVYLLQKF